MIKLGIKNYKITRRSIVRSIKTLRYHASKSTEHVWRKVLMLPRYSYSSTELWMNPPDDSPYRSMDGDKLKDSLENWVSNFHAQPRREYYAEKVHRSIFYNKMYGWPGIIRRWFSRKITKFALYRAKEFTYNSHHYIAKKGNTQMDGYLTFNYGPFEFTYTLDICGLVDLKHTDFVDLSTYGKWGFSTLVIPKKTFSVKDIDKVLKLWYDHLVEYRYRHFSHKEGRPAFILELSFMEDCCDKCHWELEKCLCKMDLVPLVIPDTFGPED